MLQTVRAKKLDEKIGVICLVSLFPSRIMVFKLPKIEIFYWPEWTKGWDQEKMSYLSSFYAFFLSYGT